MRVSCADFLPWPLFRCKPYYKMKPLLENDGESEQDTFSAAGVSNRTGQRILLVEDNELKLEIAVNSLGATGAKIETAADGEKALAQYIREPAGYYDLILLDIQMPGMNGYEAARAIRRSGKANARTLPIWL